MGKLKKIYSLERENILRRLLCDSQVRWSKGFKRFEMQKESHQFYSSQRPPRKMFADFLRNAFYPSNVYLFDTRTPFIPYDIHCNWAGFQYLCRDENCIIRIECIDWITMAKKITELIESGTFITNDNPDKETTEGTSYEVSST